MSTPPTFFPSLRQRVEHWLFDLPESLGGGPLSWLALPLRYLYALARDLFRGELGLRAMSLVYSSLFALVPIVAVSFAVLQAFGYHRQIEPALYDLLRPLGEQGQQLASGIMRFVENVRGSVLGTVGFVVLFYTVVSMIQKVESSLNFVWHVERPRSLARRVTEYVVIMLVGPVVAVLALVLLASIEASAVASRLSGLAGAADSPPHVAPYVMVIALFLFMYTYMPNTRVRIGPAAVGAVSAGVLWGAVGALFARFVVYATQVAAIYAGFAVVLLFLVWLHLSWLILLVGAQLSFYVQHPEHLRSGHEDVPMTGALRERLALSVMALVGRRFLEGGARWDIAGLAERLHVPGTVLSEIVEDLESHGLVLDAQDDTVAPARDLGSTTLASILAAVRHETPDPRRPAPRAVAAADAAAGAADDALMASQRDRTLLDLVRSSP